MKLQSSGHLGRLRREAFRIEYDAFGGLFSVLIRFLGSWQVLRIRDQTIFLNRNLPKHIAGSCEWPLALRCYCGTLLSTPVSVRASHVLGPQLPFFHSIR
jgi:hypothetical protein